jgi:hypothetical protein
VLDIALAGMARNLPLRGEPVVHPRHRRAPDDVWVAELELDLAHLRVIDPDDAPTRCRFVDGHFPGSVSWSIRERTEREAIFEWPPDIWQRRPGQDDILLHPAVRAVMILCTASGED